MKVTLSVRLYSLVYYKKLKLQGVKNNILTEDEKADIMQSISGKFYREMKSNEKKK